MYYNSILWHRKESQTHRIKQPNWGQDITTCIDMSDGYTNLWYYTYFTEKILLRSINCLIFLRIVKLQVLKNFITTPKKKNAKKWQAAQYVNPPSFFTQLKLRTKSLQKKFFQIILDTSCQIKLWRSFSLCCCCFDAVAAYNPNHSFLFTLLSYCSRFCFLHVQLLDYLFYGMV